MKRYVCFTAKHNPALETWWEVVNPPTGAVLVWSDKDSGGHTGSGAELKIVTGDTGNAIRSEHDDLPDHVYINVAKYALVSPA